MCGECVLDAVLKGSCVWRGAREDHAGRRAGGAGCGSAAGGEAAPPQAQHQTSVRVQRDPRDRHIRPREESGGAERQRGETPWPRTIRSDQLYSQSAPALINKNKRSIY